MRKTQISADWSNLVGRPRETARTEPADRENTPRNLPAGPNEERSESASSTGPSAPVPRRSTLEARSVPNIVARGPNRNAYLVEDLYQALLDHLDAHAEAGQRTNQTRVIERALQSLLDSGSIALDSTIAELVAIASRVGTHKIPVPYRLSASVDSRVEAFWKALKRRRAETRRAISRTDIVELALRGYFAHKAP